MILESFSQDLRIGFRVIVKDKVFCILSVLVLALGIGGAMTQFTVVNAIVLRGFSFPHPEQLVSVGLIDPKATDQNNNFGNGNIPATQDYEDIKAAQRSSIDDGRIPQWLDHQRHLQQQTAALHRCVCDRRALQDHQCIARARARLHRRITAGSPKVAILGDEIWRRDFNADPHIVGQAVTINGKAATIIGVMPKGFKFPISEELWTPLYNEWPPTPRGELFLGANSRAPAVMGRLKPGVSLDQANAEMVGIARHMAEKIRRRTKISRRPVCSPCSGHLPACNCAKSFGRCSPLSFSFC